MGTVKYRNLVTGGFFSSNPLDRSVPVSIRCNNPGAPYVGESAFAHKGGIHVSAVQKDPRTYEHVPPEAVGNRRRLLVSDQGGRSNILAELERIGIVTPKDDPRIARLLEVVKERDAVG
jgi:2-isopropylmalate synthase